MEKDFDYYFELAEENFDNDNLDEASVLYDKCIELKPNSYESYFRKGCIYCINEDYEAGIECFNKCLSINERFASAYYSRAIAYQGLELIEQQLNNLKNLIEECNERLSRDPNNQNLCTYRNKLYLEIKALGKNSINDFNKCIEIDPFYLEAYRNRGLLYAALSQFDNAIKDISKCIELDSDDILLYNLRGLLAYSNEEYGKAINDMTTFINKSDNNFNLKTIFTRAMSYFNLGMYKEAITDFDKFINCEDNNEFQECLMEFENIDFDQIENHISKINNVINNATGYFIRGLLFEINEDYESAIKDFTKSLTIHPANKKNIYLQRAFNFYQISFYKEAIDDYTKVIETDLNCSDAYFYRGCIYKELGKDEKALSDFIKLIDLGQDTEWEHLSEIFNNWIDKYDDYISYFLMGYASNTMWGGDTSEAIEFLDECIDRNPNFYRAYLERGICKVYYDEQEDAIEDFTVCININPNCAEAYYQRGCAYYTIDEIDKSLKDLSKCLMIDQNNGNAYLKLGSIYMHNKDKEKASLYLKKAKDLNNVSNEYQKELELLLKSL